MVCKNCGADLKPGIKYCLNCGNYIDDDDDEKELEEEMQEVTVNDSIDSESDKDDDDDDSAYEVSLDDLSESANESDEKIVDIVDEDSKKKEKKGSMSSIDMLIYGGLLLIILISFVVILSSLVTNKKKVTQPPAEVKVVDNKITVDNYTITFSGKLNYNQEKSIIYITDKENYSFSYRNKVDDYKKYASDLTIISNDLKSNGCTVLSNESKKIGNKEFLIYKYKMSNEIKYLYISPLKNKYVTMGVIESVNGGDWEKSLTVIADINSNIKFNDSDIDDSDDVEEQDEIDDALDNSLSDISNIIK